MFRTAEAERFLAAWQALRTDNGIPHYRRVFQDLPRDLLPGAMMLEQNADERYIVRFMGTQAVETWGADLTGRDVLEVFSKRIGTSARSNYLKIIGHPCGMHNIGVYRFATREEMAAEGLMLPVTNDPGMPPRILTFGQQIVPPHTLDDDRPDMIQRRWIDLGLGVPARKPV